MQKQRLASFGILVALSCLLSILIGSSSYATGENYSLSTDGKQLKGSGGNFETVYGEFNDVSFVSLGTASYPSGSSMRVFYYEKAPSYLATECNIAIGQSSYVEVHIDTSTKKTTQVINKCGTRTDSVNKSPGGTYLWDQVVKAETFTSEAPPPGASIVGESSYRFNVEKATDGRVVQACGGFFNQFVSGGCVDFDQVASTDSGGSVFPVGDPGSVLYKYERNIGGTCTATALIAVSSVNRELSGGALPGYVGYRIYSDGLDVTLPAAFSRACSSSTFQRPANSEVWQSSPGLKITITGADKLDSFLGGDVEVSGEESTCQIEGVGWIVCPVTEFLASMADGVKNVLDGFLEIPATKLFSTNPTEGLFPYWKQILDYANIVFVVVFLLIIFSQLTSVGITNYGIKKLLPKLLIVAVLVNVSFYVCALAVDLSNVLGYNLQKLLSDAIKVPSGTIDNSFGGGDNPWGNLVGSILAAGAAGVGLAVGAYFFLATVVGAIISVIIAGIIILFLLTVRQALVIILIVLSPLAFAMMLLPNTEKVFKKWWSLFKSMLLIFPIVSLLYGAGSLAATVLSSSDNRLVQVVGATLPFVSLFAVFAVFKKAMSSIEGLGNLTNKMQNGFNKLGSPLTNLAGQRDKLARENLKQKFLAGNVRGLGRMGRRFTTGRKKWDSKIAANKDEAESVADQYARANLQSYANRSTVAKQQSSNAQQAMKNAGAQHLSDDHMALLDKKKELEEQEKQISLNVETLQLQNPRIEDLTQATRMAELEKNVASKSVDANWESAVATDPSLRWQNDQLRAQTERETTAKRVQLHNYAEDIQSSANATTLLRTAGGLGIDPYGEQRAKASAIASDANELSEAVKNIETSANTADGITGFENEYKQAVRRGDVASARAYQNLLLKAGAPGVTTWKQATNELHNNGDFNTTSGQMVEESIKTNIVNNHGGMKGVDNAVMEYALDTGALPPGQTRRSLEDRVADSATYTKLSNREIIGSKAHVQVNAMLSGAIDKERADAIRADKDFNSLSEDIKKGLEEISSLGHVSIGFRTRNTYK